ncbi:MAG: tetratricopeptide repeat protein [Planctomycetota bacterium]
MAIPTKTKRAGRFNLRLLLLASIFILLTGRLILPSHAADEKPANSSANSRSADPVEAMKQADELLKQEKWKEAWQLYKQLLKDHSKNKEISPRVKNIEQNIKTCEKKLGIITDVVNLFNATASSKKKYGSDYLYLTYQFTDEKELEDFKFLEDELTLKNGKLQINCETNDTTMIPLKDAVFKDYLTLEFNAEISFPKTAVNGITFFDVNKDTGYFFSLNSEFISTQRVNLIATLTGKGGFNDVRLLSSKTSPKIEPGKKYLVKLTSEKGKHCLYIDKTLIKEVSNQDITSGAIGLGCSDGSVLISNLKIEGLLDPQWVRKTLSAANTLTLLKDDKDFKQSVESPAIILEMPKITVTQFKSLPESAQVNFTESIRLMQGLSLSLSTKEFQKNLERCTKKFSEIISLAPQFAAAYYLRASCYALSLDNENCLADLNQAITLDPGFREAYRKRGDIYRDQFELDEAMNNYEQALSLDNKYSSGYASRGYLHFMLGEENKALDDLNKAVDLNQENKEAQMLKKNVKHVLQGPTWLQTYTKETRHYLVKSNISQQKCNNYAAFLQAIRQYYVNAFGISDNQKIKKRVALIFDTETDYQTYALLSTDSSVESTLGYYHPHYRQLLLFEPLNQEKETLKVMYHEAFHMFLHEIVNNVENIPIWLNEGMAEYFGGSEISTADGHTSVKTGLVHEGRLSNLLLGLEMNKVVPFEKIMNETKMDFYGPDAAFRYAQAWSMVHFFVHYKNGLYQNGLKSYFNHLKKGKSPGAAFQETFGKQNLGEMEKEWRRYVENLKTKK